MDTKYLTQVERAMLLSNEGNEAAQILAARLCECRKQLEDLEQAAKERRDMFWPPTNDEEQHIYEIRNGKERGYVQSHADALRAK